MGKSKYQKDANGNSILGIENGITITRPWSNEMYEHNNKVSGLMKARIGDAVYFAYDTRDISTLKIIAKSLTGPSYGSGYSLSDMNDICVKAIKQAENFWLHDWAWPELVEKGIVKPIDIAMVGYNKLKN